jgi:hypothetical protein
LSFIFHLVARQLSVEFASLTGNQSICSWNARSSRELFLNQKRVNDGRRQKGKWARGAMTDSYIQIIASAVASPADPLFSGYCAVYPPSTKMSWPVVNAAPGELSQSTALAISSGVPMRPAGVCVGTIGYWLAKSYTGRGFMTAAVKALINQGFQQLELNRIQARVATGNHVSQAVCNRLGLKSEGILRQAECFTITTSISR